ncbi:MAG: choice-of-anchor B family protein [Anaerolineales bacterium]|nr:choice-of-anchor B family protein [Anaerolineales bacterium]
MKIQPSTFSKILFPLTLFLLLAGTWSHFSVTAQTPDVSETHREEIMARQEADAQKLNPLAPMAATPCVDGMAGPYACLDVDLLAFMPLATIGGGGGSNDIWGWTDPLDGKEYALVGLTNGTSFVDVTNPETPVYLGRLPTQTSNSTWRDIKVYENYAFIVSEAGGHGMQVFDLTRLRDVVAPPVIFTTDAFYNQFGNAHNIAINEATGFAYAIGTSTCSGGLHMVNIQNPLTPTNAGCYSADGYTHDTQCVLYSGPDADYQGHEICFSSNEDSITVTDVTNKAAPVLISRNTYAGSAYAHQGWLTEDQVYFLSDDELDEQSFGHNTRTRIWDMTDLDEPFIIDFNDGPNPSIDHNLYTHNGYAYMSNYTSGLQIYDLEEVANGVLTLVAYFDSYTPNNNATFNGSWSNYPYFGSGTVIHTGIGEGLFITRPQLETFITLETETQAFAFCGAGSQSTLVSLLSNAYTGDVTLSTPDLPAGTTSSFETNPVLAPGTTVMTLTVASTSAGTYPFNLLAEDANNAISTPLSLDVFDAAPGTPTLLTPASGAESVPFVPTFTWETVAGAGAYRLEVATDATFTNLVYTAEMTTTTHTITAALDELTPYHWRVVAQNACGEGLFSASASFTTQFVPSVLLVDDDNNSPNVRSYYTAALDSLGLTYDVWNTANSDDEPAAYDLHPYELVIWFTGSESNGAAGPDAESEANLASWLTAQNTCLFLSGQDYYNDRGLTSFMQAYLGVNSVETDSGNYSVVTGDSIFDGLGPLSLLYPFGDYSDRLYVTGSAQTAFLGSNDHLAAVYKQDGYQTTFMAFPFEAIYGANNRKNVLNRFVDSCDLSVAGATPTSSAQAASPGASATHTIQVVNLGTTSDTFNVVISGNQWDTTAPETLGPLTPGEVAVLEVNVHTPALATVVVSDTFTVTLVSVNDPQANTAQATGITYLNVTPGVALNPALSGVGAPGSQVIYNLTVTNTGDYTDHYTLSISDTWGADPAFSLTGPIAPGESITIPLMVQVPAGASLGESDTATLTVVSGLDMDVLATVQVTTTVGYYQTFLPVMVR